MCGFCFRLTYENKQNETNQVLGMKNTGKYYHLFVPFVGDIFMTTLPLTPCSIDILTIHMFIWDSGFCLIDFEYVSIPQQVLNAF